MQVQDPQKLAEKLLEAANSQASAASKVALAWFLALVFLWLGGLEPIVPRLNALYDKTLKANKAQSEFTDFKFKKSEYGGNEAQREERIQKLEGNFSRAKEERKKELRKARVPFSVPGFPNFEVRIRFASLVWSMLLLGLLVYLSHTRTTILRLIGRATRLLHEHDAGMLRRPTVALFIPWWVAPLPKRNGLCVTASKFCDLVGWRSNSWSSTMIVVCTLSVLCILQVRVVLIGATGALDLGYQSEPRRALMLLIGACVMVALVTMVMSVSWLRSSAVLDQSLQETNRDALSRRWFLLLAIGLPLVSLFIGAAAIRTPKLFTRWLRVPRYRQRKKPPVVIVNLPSGFYSNKRSQVIQYVSAGVLTDSRALGTVPQKHPMVGVRLPKSRKPQEHNFIQVPQLPTSEGGQTDLRLNRSARIQIIERAAIDNWIVGKKSEACELLQRGVVDDLRKVTQGGEQHPQLRLYYRLAKFALLSGQEHWVLQMVQAIQAAGVGQQFAAAIQSWTDPMSRWRKRLKYVR